MAPLTGNPTTCWQGQHTRNAQTLGDQTSRDAGKRDPPARHIVLEALHARLPWRSSSEASPCGTRCASPHVATISLRSGTCAPRLCGGGCTATRPPSGLLAGPGVSRCVSGLRRPASRTPSRTPAGVHVFRLVQSRDLRFPTGQLTANRSRKRGMSTCQVPRNSGEAADVESGVGYATSPHNCCRLTLSKRGHFFRQPGASRYVHHEEPFRYPSALSAWVRSIVCPLVRRRVYHAPA